MSDDVLHYYEAASCQSCGAWLGGRAGIGASYCWDCRNGANAATVPQKEKPMNVNDAFPSKTLKAGDLNGNNVQVVIAHVDIEKVGSGKDAETKPVVYFEGKQKGLVLNKTNAKRIVEITGSPDTDDWKGHAIVLFPTETEFQGETVDCIRIKKPQQQTRRPAPVPAPPSPPPADDFQASDDDVPF